MATALFFPLAVLAQPAPLVTPRDLRPETPPTVPAPVPQAAPQSAPAGADQLFVTPRDVAISGGYPEFAAASQQLAATIAGKRVAATEFYRVAEAIEQLYREAGYPLVRVTVPPQQVRDGETLRLVVLDGFLEHIDVEAVPAKARPGVKRAMQGLTGRPRVRQGELERALTLAGRGPGLALRSTLAQGTTAGGVILVLEGDFDAFGGNYAVDNRSSKALGQWQSTLQVRANQQLGWGEQVYAYIAGDTRPSRMWQSDAPRRIAGGGVTLPIGSNGWTVNPELTWSDTLSAATAFTPRTESKFQRATLRTAYPLVLTREQELNLTGAFEAATQKNTAPDFGALLNEDKLRVLRLGADGTTPPPWSEAGRLRMSATLSKGLSGLGARTQADAAASGIPLSRPGSEPDFLKLEAGLALDHPLPAGAQSRTLVRLQKANGVLPSAELFSLDGEDALSTFRSGSLSDDSGWLIRQEFARPVLLQAAGAQLALLPYVFAAAGRAYPEGLTPAARGLSSSWGLGVKAAWRFVNLALEGGRRKSKPGDLDGTQIFLKGQVQF